MVKQIESLIKKFARDLVRSETKTLVQFVDRDEKFVCGYSEKPKQINFYFQPLYDEPKAYAKLAPKAYLKGKSCLHLPKEDGEGLAVIEALLKTYAKGSRK